MFYLFLLILAAVAAAYLYISYRFDDPAVPVVQDLFPPRGEPPYTLLEIWAHPDDETSMGGTTAKYGRHPQVSVVACYFTCGEAGRPGVPPLCRQEELGMVRRGEMALAATAAHLDAYEIADFGDGKLAERDFAELEAQAVRWIRTYKPTVICTWDPSGSSGHPDHIRTHEVVRAAFRSAADPEAFPGQIRDDGLEPHQAQRLYETVVPARVVEAYRRFAFQGNTGALDNRTAPTHAMNVRGTVDERLGIIKAHRSQHNSLRPFAGPFGRFIYACWTKEYFTLAMSAEPSPNR